jgi:hypothetical protein
MRSFQTFLKWAAIVLLPVLLLSLTSAPLHAAQTLVGSTHALHLLPLTGIGIAMNTLGNYNETFFAQEALIQLEKVLGMAGRVYRDYSSDSKVKGDTIQIRRPSYFTATDAPATASNLATDSVSIVLNKWKEVKFALTDKDLSLTSDRIISDHIRPAAVAIADQIDQDMAALFKDIPWHSTLTSTTTLADIGAIAKLMFDNKVPMIDELLLHYMIGGAEKLAYQNALGASGMMPAQQDAALRTGSLGRLFGFDTWANQNTPLFTSGVGADSTGTVDGVNAIGATTIVFSAVTAGITWKTGDSFSIAGDTQRYVFTADGTDADGSAASGTFAPALKKATAGTEVITIFLGGAAKRQNLAFHRNAFALATAPLSDLGNQLGARIATVADPITGIALRSRMFYIGDTSTVNVALDVLYGVKTLDPNLAVRGDAA